MVLGSAPPIRRHISPGIGLPGRFVD
jgi:Transposase